ncbi:hypothetical protein MKX01_033265 [Papaver californicum]|nr:hypothetical protein MKX01_033265 [Papaver californicum]
MVTTKTSLCFLFALIAISAKMVSALGLTCGGDAAVRVNLPAGVSRTDAILYPHYCDSHCRTACPVGLQVGASLCVADLVSAGYAYIADVAASVYYRWRRSSTVLPQTSPIHHSLKRSHLVLPKTSPTHHSLKRGHSVLPY